MNQIVIIILAIICGVVLGAGKIITDYMIANKEDNISGIYRLETSRHSNAPKKIKEMVMLVKNNAPIPIGDGGNITDAGVSGNIITLTAEYSDSIILRLPTDNESKITIMQNFHPLLLNILSENNFGLTLKYINIDTRETKVINFSPYEIKTTKINTARGRTKPTEFALQP